MKNRKSVFQTITMICMTIGLVLATSAPARASSHMDAPLIVLDPAANTTDVYAFLSDTNGQQYLTVALSKQSFFVSGWRRPLRFV